MLSLAGAIIPLIPEASIGVLGCQNKPKLSWSAWPLYRRPSPDGGSTKRARASRPKVKSGCITCKARRVKCDETKPQCIRCQKFGRVCDGYATEQPQRITVVPLQPRVPPFPLYIPRLSIRTTEMENMYFQYFCEVVSHQLPGFYEASFWTRTVPQEALYVPPIRYAAIAIACLSRGLEDAAQADSLKMNIVQDVNREQGEHAAVLFARAIRALNVHISASGGAQMRTALIACILFVCFETLQGSFSSSIQQTYGGLKLLRSHYSQGPRRASASPSSAAEMHIASQLQSHTDSEGISHSNPVVAHVQQYLRSSISPDRTESPSQGSPKSVTDIPLQNLSDETQQRSASQDQRQQTLHSLHTPPKISEGLAAALDYPDLMQVVQREVMVENVRLNGAMLNASAPSPFSTMTPSDVLPSTESKTPSPSLPPPPPPLSNSQPATPNTSRKRPLASRASMPILNNDVGLEDSLIQTFARLEVQGLFFGMIPGIPPLVWDVHKLYDKPIPLSFPDYETAYRCWDFLQGRALEFYRRVLFNRTHAPELCEPLSVITQTYNSIITQLSAFEAAFRPFLDCAINLDGSVANARALVLSLYQKATLILLAAVLSESEMVYDDYFPSFQYITRTADLLISSYQVAQSPLNTRFCFETGLIPPLHTVGIRCRDPTIRREAISLLFRCHRQEGMWDSVLSARICRWLCSCEEAEGITLPELQYYNPFNIANLCSSTYVNDNKDSFHRIAFQSGMDEPNQNEPGGISRSISMASGVDHLNGSMEQTGGSYAWLIPEEKRMQLMVVDFHVPDRYIKVKCRSAIVLEDGKRMERETVIAW
ncbi:hypothetical protein F5884DRAFT_821808 [Xylogone sp. PMI_703]|nr:hypothetical protein F5884DRAFT_821808 [Xylogone sp. PMI_703]